MNTLVCYKGIVFVSMSTSSDEKIDKFVHFFLRYRHYIKNMLMFLKKFWPLIWQSDTQDLRKFYYFGTPKLIKITDDNVEVLVIDSRRICIYPFTKTKVQPVDFIEFLNNRFLLSRIWKKYNIPNDLSSWIQLQFF